MSLQGITATDVISLLDQFELVSEHNIEDLIGDVSTYQSDELTARITSVNYSKAAVFPPFISITTTSPQVPRCNSNTLSDNPAVYYNCLLDHDYCTRSTVFTSIPQVSLPSDVIDIQSNCNSLSTVHTLDNPDYKSQFRDNCSDYNSDAGLNFESISDEVMTTILNLVNTINESNNLNTVENKTDVVLSQVMNEAEESVSRSSLNVFNGIETTSTFDDLETKFESMTSDEMDRELTNIFNIPSKPVNNDSDNEMKPNYHNICQTAPGDTVQKHNCDAVADTSVTSSVDLLNIDSYKLDDNRYVHQHRPPSDECISDKNFTNRAQNSCEMQMIIGFPESCSFMDECLEYELHAKRLQDIADFNSKMSNQTLNRTQNNCLSAEAYNLDSDKCFTKIPSYLEKWSYHDKEMHKRDVKNNSKILNNPKNRIKVEKLDQTFNEKDMDVSNNIDQQILPCKDDHELTSELGCLTNPMPSDTRLHMNTCSDNSPGDYADTNALEIKRPMCASTAGYPRMDDIPAYYLSNPVYDDSGYHQSSLRHSPARSGSASRSRSTFNDSVAYYSSHSCSGQSSDSDYATGNKRSRLNSYSSDSSHESEHRRKWRSYNNRNGSRSRSRCLSYSRSRSRSRAKSRCLSRSRYRSRSRSRSRPRNYRRRRSRDRKRAEQEFYERKISERRRENEMIKHAEKRIMYVGRVPDNFTKTMLRRRFEVFGEIEETKLIYRQHYDNYGFITFSNRQSAFKAIERGNDNHDVKFDLCFGGRRQFCDSVYKDLDSRNSGGRNSDDLSFDALLSQATAVIKR